MPSSVRWTSFLLFSAAIALHHSSSTVKTLHQPASVLPPGLAVLQNVVLSKMQAHFLKTLYDRH